jgi:hypothetical protein
MLLGCDAMGKTNIIYERIVFFPPLDGLEIEEEGGLN